MWIITLALYVLMPSDSALLPLLYYGVHIVTIGSFIITLSRSRWVNRFNAGRLMCMFVIIVAVVCSGIATTELITFKTHVLAAAGFAEMLMAIYIVDSLDYTPKMTRFLYRINMIISVVFIYLSFTSYAYDSEIIGSLNLGYSNPNVAAIYILLNLAVLITYFDKNEKLFVKLIIFASGAYLFYLLYLTDSRMCFISALVILVYRFFTPKWQIPKWTILPMQLIPLVFMFWYVYLYQQNGGVTTDFMGKDFFSGRESHFVLMFEFLQENLLLGDFGVHYFKNAHNGPLAVLLNTGIVGYSFYTLFVTRTLYKYHGDIKTYRQKIALVVIYAIFIHGSAEAPMFIGGAMYSILVATIYWILKGDGVNDHQATNQ